MRALESEVHEDGAIAALQPPGVLYDARRADLWPLSARPDVAAAYARVGRDLPEALRPGASPP